MLKNPIFAGERPRYHKLCRGATLEVMSSTVQLSTPHSSIPPPNELPLNYHFTSTLLFYDSICLSISDSLHRPRRLGTQWLFNFIGHRQQAASRGAPLVIYKPRPPFPVGEINRLGHSSVRGVRVVKGGVAGGSLQCQAAVKSHKHLWKALWRNLMRNNFLPLRHCS